MNHPLYELAKRHEHRIAFDDGQVCVDYATLLQASIGGIESLRDSGVGRGDRVVWLPGNDLETLQTFWSLLLMGCVSCPVSERFPAQRKSEIVEQLDAKRLPPIRFQLEDSNSSLCEEIAAEYVAESPATITLSSGSTGQPKAVVHTLEAHIASAKGAATNMPFEPPDRWLWSLPTFHVSGFSVLVRCAVAGATIVGTSREKDLSAEMLKQLRVTHISLVGTQLQRLLVDGAFPNDSLKAVLLGGSAVSSSLVDNARERGVPVHTTYGLTETASQLTTSTATCDAETSGRVLPFRELKTTSTGEILVRGETLCLGYFSRRSNSIGRR